VRCDFGAKVFLGVVERILDECGVSALQSVAELLEILLNRPWAARVICLLLH